MQKTRIATFNVENLFSRPKLLNFADKEEADALLADVQELRAELRKESYDKPRILKLYGRLKEYVTIMEVRGKLLSRDRKKVVASGRDQWDGWIELKREKFSEQTNKNTAKVIKELKADVVCLCEVESRPVLCQFAGQLLNGIPKYSSIRLMDGNDPRGIDVGMLSRIPVTDMESHVDDRDGASEIFSRDCLELHLERNGLDLWVLLNHFKSKGGGGTTAGNNARRKRQSERVAEIVKDKFDLTKDLVIVAGDLNDTPGSDPLDPLLSVPNLFDVLAETFPNPADRWTYHYKKNEQIDYLLVSRPLRDALQGAGVYRRGIFGVEKFSGGTIQPLDAVTAATNSASDHGAVWADFEFP